MFSILGCHTHNLMDKQIKSWIFPIKISLRKFNIQIRFECFKCCNPTERQGYHALGDLRDVLVPLPLLLRTSKPSFGQAVLAPGHARSCLPDGVQTQIVGFLRGKSPQSPRAHISPGLVMSRAQAPGGPNQDAGGLRAWYKTAR